MSSVDSLDSLAFFFGGMLEWAVFACLCSVSFFGSVPVQPQLIRFRVREQLPKLVLQHCEIALLRVCRQ